MQKEHKHTFDWSFSFSRKNIKLFAVQCQIIKDNMEKRRNEV